MADWTDEQQAIIAADEPRVHVRALAGTGKTSTTEGFIQARPRHRITYLTFNRAAAQEAAERFRGYNNVKVATHHQLAYRAVGERYQKAGQLAAQDPRPWDIGRVVGARDLPKALQYRFSRHVTQTVANYCNSADADLDRRHLPDELRQPTTKTDRAIGQADVLEAARRAWSKMQRIDDPDVPMTHSGYLKLWSLSEPTIPGDVILQDEAQDTNGAVAVPLREQDAQVVMIGDPHQSIYRFRGAINAMEGECDAEYFLTGSFRCSPSVAEWANLILQWKEPGMPEMRGLGGTPSADHPATPVTLARTNGGLIHEAAWAMEHDGVRRLHFIGGVENYGLDWLAALHARWAGERSGNSFVDRFDSYHDLRKYAEAADPELYTRCQVVDEYEDRVPGLLDALRGFETTTPNTAEAIYATAHRTKGLEFNHVRLTDDYAELSETKGKGADARLLSFAERAQNESDAANFAEEVNLLYVAVTRARVATEVNSDLEQMLALSTPVCAPAAG